MQCFLFGFQYANSKYYYVSNGQNDIIGILDSSGGIVVEYEYDTWGKLLGISGSHASTIGQLNPFRYRGYYYDSETGLYYLNSRYYDPETGRFINADAMTSTGQGVLGNNMFAYCGNNPVNRADPSGHFWKEVGDFFAEVAQTVSNFASGVMDDYRFSNGTYSSSNNAEKSKPYIENFKNQDGSYSLDDNRRTNPDNIFHQQSFAFKGSKPSFSIKNGEFSLGSISAFVMTGGWEWKYFDLSLLDIGYAKLSAGYANCNLDISAMASVYAPSATLKLGDVNIVLFAHVGSIGGKLNVGSNKFDIGAAYGWGLSLSVDW